MESDRTGAKTLDAAESLDGLELRAEGGVTDADLLQRFLAQQDEGAFSELVRRHQALVMGVCSRILRNVQAAEDAFQDTFLTLARRGRNVRVPDSLAGWLHRVAANAALQIRIRNQRRSAREILVGVEDVSPVPDPDRDNVTRLVDHALDEMPEKYRLPLILCFLKGMTNESAAVRLGRPKGSMSTLLSRGLELLRSGLQRRGVAVPTALLGAAFTSQARAVSPALLAGLVRSASTLGAGGLASAGAGWLLAGPVKAGVAALLLAISAGGSIPPAAPPAPTVRAVPPDLLPATPPPQAPPSVTTTYAAAGVPAVEPLPTLPDLPSTSSDKARAALDQALERREAHGAFATSHTPASTKSKAPSTPPGLERAQSASRAAEHANQASQNARGRSGK